MPLVPSRELMADAAKGGYAVGYFESWNLESLLAVADAAEAQRSPVILGFSGIYLPHSQRVRDRLAPYAAMALAVCDALTVPACLLFNESPNEHWVSDAIDAGFNLVMFSDDNRSTEETIEIIRRLGARAHAKGAAIEAEAAPLAGVGGDLTAGDAQDKRLTDPTEARIFVKQTGIDAFAVNVGQVHLHGRRLVRLDLERLKALVSIPVPLVLHGASSVDPDDLRAAIGLGVRKINVGSRLKQAYFNALRDAAASADAGNPYEVIGSGLDCDVLVAGRLAMQSEVESLMKLFGSAGKAEGWAL
jgi:ketose-bisphosphate aldolase